MVCSFGHDCSVAKATSPKVNAQLILAEKKAKPEPLPKELKKFEKDFKKMGYNSLKVLQKKDIKKLDGKPTVFKIEKNFTVSVAPYPMKDGKVPVKIVWKKGKKKTEVPGKIKPKGPAVITGGPSFKKGLLFLIVQAQ
jgi:hypothetical protein